MLANILTNNVGSNVGQHVGTIWEGFKFMSKFKVNDRVRITKYNNTFSKGYTESCSRQIFIIDSVLKTNPWTYKIKDLNGGKIIGSFYEKRTAIKQIINELLFRTRQSYQR